MKIRMDTSSAMFVQNSQIRSSLYSSVLAKYTAETTCRTLGVVQWNVEAIYSLMTIVSRLSAPTETMVIGTPTSSSILAR
jgi:hypothetical protein